MIQMIRRYCANALRCSYGKETQPCDLTDECGVFQLDVSVALKSSGKGNKYRNRRIVVNGVKFDSTLEYRRYRYLSLLEKSGAITGLKRQVKYVLIPKKEGRRAVKYVADFEYIEDGKKVVEDCKSEATKTQAYRIKKKLMSEIHGIEIREITREDF